MDFILWLVIKIYNTMILENTNINTYKVGSALGSTSRDIGTLCTHPNINMWSKWKPIESSLDTLTLDELKYKRYGLKILEGNTVQQLINEIDNHNGIGVTYNKPFTKYRLGDFRNYNSTATIPCEKTYLDKEEINIGGVTSSNHGSYERLLGGIETMSTDTTIGVEDLYYHLDSSGQPIKLRRGAYITDGTKSEWWTDYIPWWENNMQYFANKDVTIYEFYTNAKKTPKDFYQQNGNDRFYAIPYPKYTKKIKSETPSGSKIVATILNAQFANKFGSSNPYENVSYNVYFDAKGAVYRGGTINNVWIKLCRDRDGYDIIEQKQLAETLKVEDETQSKHFIGIFNNRPLNPYESPSQNVWVIVWWNNTLQTRQMPLMERPDIQNYILKSEF